MNKLLFSVMVSLLFFLTSPSTNAGTWSTTKEYINKVEFWKSKHLKNIDFSHIYPKPLYKKSYFGGVIIGATAITAGAITYFTAGAGAPAAATGVSTVASWVAGGGAGSYMAGLSTIGGLVGGNAMAGAAILNGISMAVLGGGVGESWMTMSILSQAMVYANVTASGLDGVYYFKNQETNQLIYRVHVAIPQKLGGKKTRDIVNKIHKVEEDINEALSEDDTRKADRLQELKNDYNQDAINLLRQNIKKKDNQEDMIVLGIVAWNNNQYDLFKQAVSKINVSTLDNVGFLEYLYALNDIWQGNIKGAILHLDNSIASSPYTIEPAILYVNILGNERFLQNEPKIKLLTDDVKENFNSDKYQTQYSLPSLFYRVGTFYFSHKRYVAAQHYYEEAYNELGVFQKHFFSNRLKHIVQVAIANSILQQGKTAAANKLYNEMNGDIDDVKEKAEIRKLYMGRK